MIIHLMPSEIARLVLGYLRETDCKETENTFLNECKHLSEYVVGLRNGINYSTHINGKSLIELINDYSRLQNSSQQTQQTETTSRQSEDKTNDSKTNEELKRLSEQLTKIESLLNKLIQKSNNPQINTNQNNYRLIASPPILQTTSPLLINTVGLNSTPIQANKTQEPLLNKVPTPATPVTPARSDINSPRRKRVPRRRVLSGSSPFRHSGNSSHDDSMDQTLVNSSSDQIRDESEPQLKIDINEPLVQPEFIVGELLNFEPIHDILAENINKIKGKLNSIQNSDENKELNKEDNSNEQNIDPQEIHIDDQTVNTILASLESAPEFNNLLDKITEKELQMTPYKNLFSVESNSSSASSLNTPKTPQMRVEAQKVIEGTSSSVIKNLMTDLKTPEKTITLYAARSPSLTTITPAKVTPVKIIRTDMTQDLSYLVNDKNGPIIVPKVSLFGEDYNLLQNTITNSATTYTVSIQSVPNQQFLNSNNIAATKPISNKRVDFTKPASELQMPRKILPKPIQPDSTLLSTTITPVQTHELVTKQPLNTKNSNSNPSETNRQKPKSNESQSEPPSKSPKQTPPINQNNKRPNSGSNSGSPNKIKATNVRLPSVNILRKMNQKKMNQFLDKVHSNKNNK